MEMSPLSADRQWWRRYDLQGRLRNPLQADHLTYENYNRTGRTPVGTAVRKTG